MGSEIEVPSGRPPDATTSNTAAPSSVEGGRLTSREVAVLLGVKVQTVYAYASRGLLHSERVPGGRGSTFDATEVDRLRAESRSRTRSVEVGAPQELPAARSAVTLVEAGRLHYRGVDAVDLVMRHSFEGVAGWLWREQVELAEPFVVPPGVARMLRRAGESLPARSRLTDRLRVAVTVAAAADPLRFDLREENVLLTARTVIGALIESLPPPGGPTAGWVSPTAQIPVSSPSTPAAPAPVSSVSSMDVVHSVGSDDIVDPRVVVTRSEGASVAARLWSRLTTAPADRAGVICLDDALGLLADHDLAVSTLAARVAASARADPYAVVSAGLAALDGPAHGGASRLAHRMLSEVIERDDAVFVVSEYLRAGQPIPGLRHPLYPDGDPRARAVLDVLAAVPSARPYLAAARQVTMAAARDSELHPNIDMALAVLTLSAGMPAEAGEVIFAVARTVGWIAHALEEYREPPLRLRSQGRYVGRRPPRPVP